MFADIQSFKLIGKFYLTITWIKRIKSFNGEASIKKNHLITNKMSFFGRFCNFRRKSRYSTWFSVKIVKIKDESTLKSQLE